MSKSLFFERLALSVRIGTGSEERARPQRLLLSGDVQLVDGLWGNDAIQKTVDYDRLLREIVAKGEETEFCLLERLSEEIVDHLMTVFPGVSAVTLTLWKDPPPLALSLDRVGLTIRETRERWSDRHNPGRFPVSGEKTQEGIA